MTTWSEYERMGSNWKCGNGGSIPNTILLYAINCVSAKFSRLFISPGGAVLAAAGANLGDILIKH